MDCGRNVSQTKSEFLSASQIRVAAMIKTTFFPCGNIFFISETWEKFMGTEARKVVILRQGQARFLASRVRDHASRERYLHEARYRYRRVETTITMNHGNFHDRLQLQRNAQSHYRPYSLTIYSTGRSQNSYKGGASIALTTNPGDNWFRVRIRKLLQIPPALLRKLQPDSARDTPFIRI